VKPDAYRGPPPSEGQFREFVTRLLRVPKREIDERERARKAASPRIPSTVKLPPDKPKTEG
jgi:hypothetical protein